MSRPLIRFRAAPPSSASLWPASMWLACASILGVTGCAASGLPPIVDIREVRAASGQPSIRKITDAGTALIPRSGPIEAITDGVAGPGELLVVEGAGFGRQPAVSIGGRPAAVLARTRGGGLVVRVPGGIDTGLVDVTVSTPSGTARLATTLRRLAATLSDEHLRFISVGKDGLVPVHGELAIPGGRAVRVDSTGGVALVLADAAEASQLVVVDLGRREPFLLGRLALPHRGAALAVAALAPRVAIVGGGKLSVVDTTSLRRPVLFDAVPLPKEVRTIRAAELSPDGHVLAILLAEGNRVIAIDISSPTLPQLISSVDILPNERQPQVRDLAFSPDGQTLWVLSGASAETHPQVIPTRITAVRLVAAFAEGGVALPESGEAPAAAPVPARPIPAGPIRRMLAVWKTQTVTGAGAPLALSVGQPPEQQGSAIRNTPEVATVFITAAKDALLELKRGAVDLARVKKLMGPPNAGMIARAELASGGGPIATTRELLGALAVPPDAQHALALALRPGDTDLELGLARISLDGQALMQFSPLQRVDAKAVHAPFTFGDLAIQP